MTGRVQWMWFGAAVAAAHALLTGCGKTEGDAAHEPPARAASEKRDELLHVGDVAPGFEAVAHSGQFVRLADLRGKVVVLYFYPKDGTPGCTEEAKQFASHHRDLDAAGAVVLGVSADGNASHRGFAEKHGLPFLLLPDTERTIAKAYGVGAFLGMTSRVTYVIDRKGRVARIYPSVNPSEHASRILGDIESL